MKKILYILNVANRVNNFSEASMLAAQKLGYEFHIAGNWGYRTDAERKDDEKKYGIKIFQVDFIRIPYDLRNIKAYRQIVSIMQKEKYDIVHCNTPIGGIVGRIAAKRSNVKKVIYQVHGFHFYKGASLISRTVFKWVEMLLAHWTDAIITINKEDYESALKFNLKKCGKIYYLPGVGIDTNIYISNFTRRDIIRQKKREELGIPLDKFLIISVGELNGNKNNQIIIKAMAKTHISKIQYVICGTGEKQRKLEVLADKLGINNQIYFLGYRTDIKDLYQISDLFVMASFREGMPRSLMEAMASGLPCIVSNIRGNVDLIKDNVNGILCDPKDENAFAKAIVNLFNNETVRTEMGRRNIDIIQDFDLDKVIRKTEKLYLEVLNA